MDLEKLLGEELFKQVNEKLDGKKILIDEGGQYIPKARFDEVNAQKKELKEEINSLSTKITENNSMLEKFQSEAGASKELKQKLKELQDLNANTQSEYEKKMQEKEAEWTNRELNAKKAFAVKEKLYQSNVLPNFQDVAFKQIDLDKITIDENGNAVGVDDMIGNIKTTLPEMFGKEIVLGTGAKGTSGETPKQFTKEAIENMSADEINKYFDTEEFQNAMKTI